MNKSSQKVLVTGVAGFLGSHLAEKLADEGHEVFGVDNIFYCFGILRFSYMFFQKIVIRR